MARLSGVTMTTDCPIRLFMAIVVWVALVQWPPAGGSEFNESQTIRHAALLKTSITWTGNTLRDGLMRFAAVRKIDIFLDRRVDPSQTIAISARDVTEDEFLRQVADLVSAGLTQIGELYYIGPRSTTENLATVAALRREELRQYDANITRRWFQSQAMSWKKLTQPKILVRELAAENAIEIDSVNQIPHDLWAAGQLPNLSLADRLTILLSGFGLTYQVTSDGTAILPIEFPKQPTFDHIYEVQQGGIKRFQTALSSHFPDAVVRIDADGISVRGRWESHQWIKKYLAGNKPLRRPSRTNPDVRFTLKVEQTVVALLRVIVEQQSYQLVLEEGLDQQLDQRITVDVKDVTEEELLRAVLEPADLAWRMDGKKLVVISGVNKD